ncbi:Uncharacterised protein [Mycobacteroides abscessus subsp. massiliense]|nr:Uncharacterised protein [Mycobacteroides abscessus subsp. massiliense]
MGLVRYRRPPGDVVGAGLGSVVERIGEQIRLQLPAVHVDLAAEKRVVRTPAGGGESPLDRGTLVRADLGRVEDLTWFHAEFGQVV